MSHFILCFYLYCVISLVGLSSCRFGIGNSIKERGVLISLLLNRSILSCVITWSTPTALTVLHGTIKFLFLIPRLFQMLVKRHVLKLGSLTGIGLCGASMVFSRLFSQIAVSLEWVVYSAFWRHHSSSWSIMSFACNNWPLVLLYRLATQSYEFSHFFEHLCHIKLLLGDFVIFKGVFDV